MSFARKALLALSTNRWLRERATKTAFVRRSVSTFMPGERLEDAMAAAAAQQARTASTIPLGRYGAPDDFGRVGAFLLSGPASYITGASVQVDGGLIKGLL